MSKQTRRSVSISRELYDRLKAYCQAEGISMSSVVEKQCRALLVMEPQMVRKVEVVRTVAVAPVHPEAKPWVVAPNPVTIAGKTPRIIPKPEALAARKIQIADEAARRLDPEEVGQALGASKIVKVDDRHCPPAPPPSNFGMSKKEVKERKAEVDTERPGGNIFTF